MFPRAPLQLVSQLATVAANDDDQPLYLFDPTFGATAPALLEAYEPPVYFRDDLFSLLDEGLPSERWQVVHACAAQWAEALEEPLQL